MSAGVELNSLPTGRYSLSIRQVSFAGPTAIAPAEKAALEQAAEKRLETRRGSGNDCRADLNCSPYRDGKGVVKKITVFAIIAKIRNLDYTRGHGADEDVSNLRATQS
jgi:hypothetical protein